MSPAKGHRKQTARRHRLFVRVTTEQIDAYNAAAKRAGRSRSKWVRAVLDAMAGAEDTNVST